MNYRLIFDRLKSKIVSVVCNVAAKSGAIVEEKNISLYGKTYITDYLGNLRFDISANSFFQVNSQQTHILFTSFCNQFYKFLVGGFYE